MSEVFDGSVAKSKTRTVALAAMIGAVILAMALGESVTIRELCYN